MTPEWMEQAACRRRENRKLPWINVANLTLDDKAAMLAVCAACPVRVDCENDRARYGDRYGVRAGKIWGEAKFEYTGVCRGCGNAYDKRVTGSPVFCSRDCARDSRRTYFAAYDNARGRTPRKPPKAVS